MGEVTWYEVRTHVGTIEDASHITRFHSYERAREVALQCISINPSREYHIFKCSLTDQRLENLGG